MKTTIIISGCMLVLSSCTMNTSPDNHIPGRLDSIKVERDTVVKSREFKGLYHEHFAHLTNCENNTTYVVKNPQKLDSLFHLLLPNAYTDQAIYVEMNAVPDPADPGAIVYTEGTAIKAEPKSHKNICQASGTVYWFWGTEPFWTLEISEAQDLIDLYDPMTQSTTHFSYVKPKVKAGVTYFETTDGENKISVQIKNEKCNGATDKQYDLSAAIKLNDKTLKGCGTAYYYLNASDAQF